MVNPLRRSAETVSTSRADDEAFRALIDAARLTAELDDARIVGGQMVNLLGLVYPNAPRIDRRTADADLGVSLQLAATTTVHDLLTNAEYRATSGNSYVRDAARIDVLAPSSNGRFVSRVVGSRAIDLTPGLSLAVSGAPVVIDLGVTFLDGSYERAVVRVPRVEVAVVLKSLATRSRTVPKDFTDLHNLLEIAYAYDDDDIGGWKLNRPCIGERLDGARALHDTADRAAHIRAIDDAGIPRERLVALIRELVARPAR